MRPPSYYASIVKSNTGHHHLSSYGSSSGPSSSSDYPITPRTSSQQLRSSLSSPSSSNYVSRSHLPFVPQSTLVAHCFTGVGSSTRPYGNSPTGSSASSTSGYLSRNSSRSGLGSSSTTRASSYGSPYASSISSSIGSRPSSTKRSSHYTSTASSSYTSSYLSPSSSRYSRPTNSSSYYKPIRLRERPLLTQISRHINSIQPSPTTTTTTRPRGGLSSSPDETTATTTSHSKASASEQETKIKLSLPGESDATAAAASQQDESNWSSDIGRNISRNKYLIKFREFDRHARPSIDVEATIQLPPTTRDSISHERDSSVPERDSLFESPVPTTTIRVSVGGDMKLLAPRSESELVAAMPKRDREDEELKAGAEPKSSEEKAHVVKAKERKNVMLRLKPIGAKKKKPELEPAEATTSTEITSAAATAPTPSVPKATSSLAKPLKEVQTSKVTASKPRAEEPLKIPEPQTAAPKIIEEAAKQELTETPVGTAIRTSDKKLAKEKSASSGGSHDQVDKENQRQTVPVTATTNSDQAAQIKKVTTTTTAATTRKKKRKESSGEILVGAADEASDKAAKQAEAQQGESVRGEPPKTKSKVVKKKVVKKTTTTTTQPDGKSAGELTGKTNILGARKASLQAVAAVAVDTKQSGANKEAQTIQQEEPLATSLSAAAGAEPPKQPARIKFREYNIHDFNFLTVLGHGGWGFVILAELKEHDACFAVKCIKKITIVEDDDYDSIMIERKMLTLGNIHPFICKLFCTFETPGYLFFVMEYCAGGDLMFHVQHEGKFTEPRCRFYAAEIICAVRFLHNRHIIYRDLKLDNILLDERGHVRLVDFGMCQCRTYREEMLPSNFCGTPEYISPEIIKGVPYNHSVDWWSFGVLLYEMAVGKMPFRGNDENELLWNVCYEQIHYPMFLTKELTVLLKSLLEREPTKRMGMATCKAGDIYDQPWFRSVDWKAVEELRVEPPFVPEVQSNRDVSNFDSDFTESTCELSPVDESTLARIDQKQFEKFPYTNPDIFIFDQTHTSK